MARSVILVLHPSRPEAHEWARRVVKDLISRHIEVLTSSEVDIQGVVKKTELELKKSVGIANWFSS